MAGRVFDALSRRFGRARVFKDVDSLRPGADFGAHIQSLLPKCRVVLILIGPGWLDARDQQGRRRLDDPNDWVRIEVETALASPGLDVVPVLVNGARMPAAEELPAGLASLARRHAAVIRRDPDFHDDVARLIAALRGSVVASPRVARDASAQTAVETDSPKAHTRVVALLAAIATVTVVGIGALLWPRPDGASTEVAAVTHPESVNASEGNEKASETRPSVPSAATVQEVAPNRRSLGATPGGAERSQEPPPAAARSLRGEFDDCGGVGWCPTMVVVPAGRFQMGSPVNEAGRNDDEGPQRIVAIAQFAASKFEVTFEQWNACTQRGGCAVNPNPRDEQWGRGSRPVINVSWTDAQAYVTWLSQETRQQYRLLTEAEWEYAARAGTTSAYSTGVAILATQANFGGRRTQPVGAYAPNAFGLYDMHGNVWEWTQDCYAESYAGLPSNATAHESGRCLTRVGRGGSGTNAATLLRSALRRGLAPGGRSGNFGFRVARNVE